jgi:hypothetical protein
MHSPVLVLPAWQVTAKTGDGYPARVDLPEYGVMVWPLVLRRATGDHLETIIGLIEDASSWLQAQGIDQWARPWPTRAARNRRIIADLYAARTWIGWDSGTAAATITVDPRHNLAWPDEFRGNRLSTSIAW